jgi:hypothetical protein
LLKDRNLGNNSFAISIDTRLFTELFGYANVANHQFVVFGFKDSENRIHLRVSMLEKYVPYLSPFGTQKFGDQSCNGIPSTFRTSYWDAARVAPVRTGIARMLLKTPRTYRSYNSVKFY